jgi:hypothetical protein
METSHSSKYKKLEENEARLKREINVEMEKIDKIQEELREKKWKVEEMQHELERIHKRMEQENILDNIKKEEKMGKKRNLEELSENQKNKKKRKERFEEELLQSENDHELTEEDAEETDIKKDLSRLSRLFLRANGKEDKRTKTNRKLITYWYDFAKEYEERYKEIEKRDISKKEQTIKDELNREIEEETKWTRGNVRKKLEGARKIYYLFSNIGKENIRKMKSTSVNTILEGTWKEIKELKEKFFRTEMEKDDHKFREISPLLINK